MAADVSSLVRFEEDQRHGAVGSDPGCGESTAPITRDLLGGSFKLPESQELDLDLHVPNGWEKRLDLKSGKVYMQRSNSPSSISSLDSNRNQTFPKLEDLNSSLSPSKRRSLNLFDESTLDLKLVSSSSSSSSSSRNYQSVCTLDKVKFALERAEKEPMRKRTSLRKQAATSPMKEAEEDMFSLTPVAAGCPACLLYVLISKNDPKCPRCNSVVPVPLTKKPRIDLNMSI